MTTNKEIKKKDIYAQGIDFKKGWYMELKNGNKVYKKDNEKEFWRLWKIWEQEGEE